MSVLDDSSARLSDGDYVTMAPPQPPPPPYPGGGRRRRRSSCHVYHGLADLIHLSGPLTEDAVLRALHARFHNRQYYTHVGGGVLLVTTPPPAAPPGPGALHLGPSVPELRAVVREAVSQLEDTAVSQTIVLNGCVGSGKTLTALLLLRELFDAVGGGQETDAFKHLNAALTVLRSLGTAATPANRHSSRVGYFVESHMTDGAIYKTKIHGYTGDQSRVTRLEAGEKNYHVFYEMLAGLSAAERAKYHLASHTPHTLHYLSQGDSRQDVIQDRARFDAWKTSLLVLGIPLNDILRIMAAILLLGNIEFIQGDGLDLEVSGNNEIKSVAALLGLSGVTLYRCLTTQSHQVRGQVFRSAADPVTACCRRDSLARALYMRTLAAIIKRANSAKCHNYSTASSSSNDDSNAGQDSQQASPALPRPRSPTFSQTSSCSHVKSPSSDGAVAILDMFGFEHAQQAGGAALEALCINLAAETLQHFYNTHVFKAAEEAAIDEGIQAEIDIAYAENAPIVELISSQRTGILSLLDGESFSPHGSTETFLQKVLIQHKMNPHFQESATKDGRHFTIRHFAGDVNYDLTHFVSTNRDLLADDVIMAFNKHNCNFGFVSHLFVHDIKAIQERKGPTGRNYRTCALNPAQQCKSDDPSSLCVDFHTKLDGLLNMLVHTNPHFVRTIKTNREHFPSTFQRDVVVPQLRALQVLETLHVMAAGFPHQTRYRVFNQRYCVLAPPGAGITGGAKDADKAYTHTKLILEHFLRLMDESDLPYSSAHWALGKKHIFLSESARQQLELFRCERRRRAAVTVQAAWRRHVCQKRWPALRQMLARQQLLDRQQVLEKQQLLARQTATIHRKHSKHSLSSDPGADSDDDDLRGEYGLELTAAPPLPAARSYTVNGNVKMGFPQTRVMMQTYSDMGGSALLKGTEILVVAASPKRGFLIAEWGQTHVHVPYQLTRLRDEQTPPNSMYSADV